MGLRSTREVGEWVPGSGSGVGGPGGEVGGWREGKVERVGGKVGVGLVEGDAPSSAATAASSSSSSSSSSSFEEVWLLFSSVCREAVAVLGSGEITPIDSSSSGGAVLAD